MILRGRQAVRTALVIADTLALLGFVGAWVSSYTPACQCLQCGDHSSKIGWHLHLTCLQNEPLLFGRSGWVGVYIPKSLEAGKTADTPSRLELPWIWTMSSVAVSSELIICTYNVNLLILLLVTAIWPCLITIRRALSFVKRRKRCRLGLCLKCGYDLRGITHHRCPECGSTSSRALHI